MGVVGWLNALDERAGARGPLGPKRWEARLRLWWLSLVSAYGTAILGLGIAIATDSASMSALPLALLPGAFYSGFLYAERLRALGRRPRLLEVPAGWPELRPALAPGEASRSSATSETT